MQANGCPRSICEWPCDKALNLTPVSVRPGGCIAEMWCEWSNYPAPLTTRLYVICPDHYRMCLNYMIENVALEAQTDTYYEKEVKVPRDCIKSTQPLHSRRSR